MSVNCFQSIAFVIYFFSLGVKCQPLNDQNMHLKSGSVAEMKSFNYGYIQTSCQISINERIMKCKDSYPDFDFEILEEDDKVIINHQEQINPCRTDCVLYTPPKRGDWHNKRINTVFFTDNRPCLPNKVCKNRNGVGVCSNR